MGKGSKAPQAPDTSAISNAQAASAAASTATAADQLAWAKSQGLTDQATTDNSVKAALGQQDANNANAAKDRNTYDSTATPALQKLQHDADTYGTQEFKDQQVGAAQAGVAQQFDAARNNSTQSLESYGVNPASTRFGALDIGTRAQQAAAAAAAGNTAIKNTDDTERALQQQVFTDANPLAAQATSESQAGTAAGTAAVNNDLATTATGAAAQGTDAQFTGLANQALTGQDTTVDNSYNNSLNQFKGDQSASSGVGSVLGGIAGIGLGVAGLGGSSVGGSAIKGLFGAQKAAAGGAIGDPDEVTPGGAVPVGASPTGGKAIDDVPAQLTVGEFVIPKDVAAWKGEEHFQKLIQQARQQKQQAAAKPTIGPATGRPTTFQSRPQQGAIPMGKAA